MTWLRCPYLGRDVELTDERREHIKRRHPDLMLGFTERIGQTLANPDRAWIATAYLARRCLGGPIEWSRD